MGKIAATAFARMAYVLLRISGWKRKTIRANANHVAESLNGANVDESLLLKNLTRHASELLFCFDVFKKLPSDLTSYPCSVGGMDFSIDESSVPVLKKMRNGGIFLTAHYGNYESLGPWLCNLEIPLVASYIPIKPKWLNYILEQKIRSVNGKTYSVDAQTPRRFLRILDSGKLFCLLADQDSRIPGAHEETFLGCSVNVNPLPDFLLKHRPQTPIFICWVEERKEEFGLRRVRELHAMELSPVKEPLTHGKLSINVSENASVLSLYNRWLEQRILENPNMWYGFTHRRFYSRVPEIYR